MRPDGRKGDGGRHMNLSDEALKAFDSGEFVTIPAWPRGRFTRDRMLGRLGMHFVLNFALTVHQSEL
jgi:hypothetical protein